MNGSMAVVISMVVIINDDYHTTDLHSGASERLYEYFCACTNGETEVEYYLFRQWKKRIQIQTPGA
jgi:hypothetical protein